MKELKLGAPAHHAAVANARRVSQNSTGSRPKYIENTAGRSPPPANPRVAPAREWPTVASLMPQYLHEIVRKGTDTVSWVEDSRRLWKLGCRSSSGAVVWQKSCCRKNQQNRMFLRPVPIQRIFYVIAGLGYQDCAPIVSYLSCWIYRMALCI